MKKAVVLNAMTAKTFPSRMRPISEVPRARRKTPAMEAAWRNHAPLKKKAPRHAGRRIEAQGHEPYMKSAPVIGCRELSNSPPDSRGETILRLFAMPTQQQMARLRVGDFRLRT